MDAKHAGLDVTLFERIEELTGGDRTRLIATQFRMRDEIVRFSNKRYYEGRIETAPVAAEQDILDDLPPAAFQHVTGKENPRQKNGSISNDWEVEGVAAVIEKLRPDIRDKGWTVAVLTPYQAQRESLRRRLPDVEVSTVDGAQGREWDVVLYSAVRSNPQHRLGFVSDERRLNVAVTRARKHFILVGDERTLSDHDGFKDLIEGSEKIRIRYQTPEGAPTQGVRKRRNKGGGGQLQDGQQPSGKRRRRRRRRGPRRQDGDDGAGESAGAESNSKPGDKGGAPRRPKASSEGRAASKDDARPPRKAKPSSGGRCTAVTKSGERCKNKARPGSATCARHG